MAGRLTLALDVLERAAEAERLGQAEIWIHLAELAALIGPPALTPPPADLLTIREVAATLRVSQKTMIRWRASGEGPRSANLGERNLRYRRRDVDAWLDEQFGGQS